MVKINKISELRIVANIDTLAAIGTTQNVALSGTDAGGNAYDLMKGLSVTVGNIQLYTSPVQISVNGAGQAISGFNCGNAAVIGGIGYYQASLTKAANDDGSMSLIIERKHSIVW